MITVERCPCGHPSCSDYHLRGVGKFVQGSGFTKQEAAVIAAALNGVMETNFDNVANFHKKFDLLVGAQPQQLTKRKLKERIEFLYEEFTEFMAGCGFAMQTEDQQHPVFGVAGEVTFHEVDEQDTAEQADALIDLVYVAMGTAVMMGLPWQQLWDDVHRANMSKVRGVSHRGHQVDCVKPEGWVGPKTVEILYAAGYDPSEKEVDDAIHAANDL